MNAATDSTTDTQQPLKLFARGRIAALSVLAGGTGLYAMNLYFTSSLLPSIVADIGGAELYPWVATGFLMAAVVSAMLVSRTIGQFGARGAYLLGFGVFALGSLAAALSPVMEVFVLSRVFQGIGGGLLAGLGFAVLRSTLPTELWLKGGALISAMWGIGALIGPSIGGVFAELEAWRLAFGVLAAISLVLAGVAVRALPAAEPQAEPQPRERLPYLSLITLVAAAASFSLAPLVGGITAEIALVVVGALFLLAFVAVEARAKVTVLPRVTFERRNPLKWVYLLVATLCAGVLLETYVPLFGQQLGGLSPLWAGFLGSALSIGWTSSQLVSVRLGERAVRVALIAGPAVLALGLCGYGLTQRIEVNAVWIAAWAVLLVVAGAGIGSAFPHLSVRALGATTDEAEGQKAAAALSTTQLIAYAVVSALLGVFAAGGPASDVAGVAERISLGLAAITALGIIIAVMLLRTSRTARTD